MKAKVRKKLQASKNRFIHLGANDLRILSQGVYAGHLEHLITLADYCRITKELTEALNLTTGIAGERHEHG